MSKKLLFDSLGAQVQVQNATHDRLTTWLGALASAGYTVNYTDPTQPLSGQLQGNQVFIVTTRQQAVTSIPPGTSFAYDADDLSGMQTWIRDEGGSLLLFVNHSAKPPFNPAPPRPNLIYWPIYDIQLAAALGITTVFALIDLTIEAGKTVVPMPPNPDAPRSLIAGVATVQAWDSGGIVPVMSNGSGIVLVPLPADRPDSSGLSYQTADLAFAVLYTLGQGKIIVIGHSGITGNQGTPSPSWGQIEYGDNLRFLMNCVAYLASPRPIVLAAARP